MKKNDKQRKAAEKIVKSHNNTPPLTDQQKQARKKLVRSLKNARARAEFQRQQLLNDIISDDPVQDGQSGEHFNLEGRSRS